MTLKHNRSMPRAVATPALVYQDMDMAIGWLSHTFGFKVEWHLPDHGALLSMGGGEVFVRPPRSPRAIADDPAGEVQALGGASCRGSILWRLEGDPPDLAVLHQRVARTGAQVLREPTDEVYGERQFVVSDPEGHHWTFSVTLQDVAPQEWGAKVG